MAELVMDNPFPTNYAAQYAKTVADIKDCVQKLKDEFMESKIPINDDNFDLHRFCAKLEYLLQAGLKGKTGVFGGKKDYWNYFCDCLGSNKSLNDGIRFVKSVSTLRTNLGRGRAFLRFGLVQQRLADTLQQCIIDTRSTGAWYEPKSVWLHQDVASEIISHIYDLNELQFDLNSQGYDLDASWPSFAKKPYGMLSVYPPSRSTSIGSLNSIPPSQTSAVDNDIQSQVDELEHSKLAAEHKNETLEQRLLNTETAKTQIEDENKFLKTKMMELEVNSTDAFKKSGGNDVLCEKLANELKMKEELFAEKEQLLQSRLEDSKQTIDRLEENLTQATNLISQTNQQKDSTNIDMMELRGKIKVAETNKKCLEMDLQGTRKELAARGMVDSAKGQLIDMQDKKIEQQKTELKKLQERIEDLLGSKTADVEKYVQVSNELNSVKADLIDREKAYESLLNNHKEVKEMLHSIEKKSTDIGKLAKEKLMKYSEENKSLKEKVEELEGCLKNNEKGESSDLSSLKAEKQMLIEKLKQTEAMLSEKVTNIQDNAKLQASHQQEISDLKAVIQTLKSDTGSKESELTDTLVCIQANNAKLNEELTAWKEKTDSLQLTVDSKFKEWCDEKAVLLCDIDTKSKELDLMNSNLSDKITILEECEKEMETEKQLLVEQLEGQTGEIELLKQELTGLSKLLGQACDDEANGDLSVENISSSVTSLIEKSTILQKSVETMEARNVELLTNTQLNDDKLQKACAELDKFRSERAGIEIEMKRSEAKIEELQDHLNEKISEMGNMVSVQSEFELKIQKLEERMKHNKDVIEELKEESETKDNMIDAKQEQFKGVNIKVQLMQQLIDELDEDKNNFEEQVNTLKSDLETKEAKLTEMVTRIESQNSSLCEQEKQLNEMRGTCDKAQTELSKKQEYLSTKENEQVQMLESSSRLESQLDQNEAYRKLLEGKVKDLKQEVEQQEILYSEFSKSMESKTRDLEESKLKVIEENVILSANLEKVQKVADEHLLDLDRQKETKIKLSSKIDKLEQDCDNFLQDRNHFEKENASLTDCVKKMENEMAILEENRGKLKVEVESLKKMNDESNNLQHELLTQAEQTSSSLLENESMINELRVTMDKMKEDISEKDQQCEEISKEKESLLVKVNELEKEKDELSESMNASYFELKEKLGQFECENETLREELQRTIAQKETLFSKFTEENSCFQGNFDLVKEELNVSNAKVVDLEEEIKTQAEEILTFQVTMSQKDIHINEVEKQKCDIDLEKKEIHSIATSKVEAKDEELKSFQMQVDELKCKLQEKEQEVTMLQDTHQQELKAMKFQLSTEEMQHQNSLEENEEKQSDVQIMTEKMNELECQIEDLQCKYNLQADELQQTIRKHTKEVDDFDEKLNHKDNECQLMAEKLVQNSHVIDRERTDYEKLQKERKLSDSHVKVVESSLSDVESENIELKKKIIELIREKDTMWKKSDKLQVKQKLMKSQITGVWADSSEIINCCQCNVQFGFTVRKHHCRLCGQIFCHYCCNNWVMTSFSNKQERVCGECLMHQSHLESASEGEDTDTEDQQLSFEQSVVIPSLMSPKWKQKPNQTEDLEESTALMGAVEVDIEHHKPNSATAESNAGHHGSMENSRETCEASGSKVRDGKFMEGIDSIDEEKLLNMTDERKSGRLHQVGASGKESSVSPSDDGYDLITTDEVVQSSETPVPDPDTEMATLLTTEDFVENKVINGASDLWIQAGKAYATAIKIVQKGTSLKWEFTTYPKDINFSMTYRESEWTAFEESDTLIPVCKCNSHKKPINGELLARKPGIYTLIFDNKLSRFTSKKLVYKLQLNKEENGEDVT